MHPLSLWSASLSQLAEREREAAALRAQRDSGIEQPAPLTRDERWRAAIQRWAAAEPHRLPAPAPSPTPRMRRA